MAEADTHEIQVQYRDLDPRAHVNHAVYVSYVEQAEGRYVADELRVALDSAGTVVRHLELDYSAPVEAGRTVAVTDRPAGVGATSFTLEYELTVSGETVATGLTVSVLLGSDGPRPLPDEWRAVPESTGPWRRREAYCLTAWYHGACETGGT